MPDTSFMALLDRYLAGECTAPEAERIREWLSSDPANHAVLAEVEAVRRVAHSRPPASNADMAWRRAVEALGLETISGSGSQPQREAPPVRLPFARRVTGAERARTRGLAWRAIAACLVLAASSAVIFGTLRHASAPMPAMLQAREFTTVRGQRASIQLADGSELTIGPASVVRIAADFGDKSRDLTLVGEAHFKVRHDSAKPFRVRTSNGTVEDLGTEFVVNSYPDSRSTQVVVASGKVALGGTALTRGQMGQVDKTGLVTVASNVDLDLYFGWTQGRISFRDTPIIEAFPSLGRWYDLNFKIADATLGSLPLTASFRNESLPQVLAVLDYTLGLRHELHGRTVTFYRRK